MNQRTFSLIMPMSDAQSRPLWGQLPEGAPGYTIAGSPIKIASQMPDWLPGSTPVGFGNWKQAYTLVARRRRHSRSTPAPPDGACSISGKRASAAGRLALI